MKIRPLTKVDLGVKGPACADSGKKDWISDANRAVARSFENLFKKHN